MDEKQVVDDLREQAFRRHYDRIYRYLRRRTYSDDEAQELAQMVFVEAAARLEHFKPGATPVLAWLYTVAQRRLVDRARVAARRHETITDLDAARLATVEELVYGPGVARAVGAALGRLPERQRQVAVMKLLEGRSFADIARRVGATEAACKMRFARALEALRDELEREGICTDRRDALVCQRTQFRMALVDPTHDCEAQASSCAISADFDPMLGRPAFCEGLEAAMPSLAKEVVSFSLARNADYLFAGALRAGG